MEIDKIPPHEQWLFKNKKALESVRRGIYQSLNGDVVDLGSFAKYLEDET